MTVQQLVDSAIALPEIKRLILLPEQGGLGYTVNDLSNKLKDLVPSVVIEAASAYEWDFAIESSSTTSVAGQAEYTLKGEDKNALNIASAEWGTSNQPLTKKTIIAMDKLLNRHTLSVPSYWTPAGRDGKYPIIKIFSTPAGSGTTIPYRYWRSDVKLDQFSPVIDHFLTIVLARRMLPNMKQEVYDNALVSAIERYDRDGGEVDITEQDSVIVAGNIRRGNMYGYGGTR